MLVADGRSTDGTRQIVERYAARHSVIRLLDNPEEITPTALNRAVQLAGWAVFPVLHFAHGLGYLRGVFDFLIRNRRRAPVVSLSR